MIYLHAGSSITHQETFQSPGFSMTLPSRPLQPELQHPDYRQLIPAGTRRRMSDVLKIGVVCTKDAISQAGVDQVDGIIVGTAHGCSIQTQRFLDKIHDAQGGILSPTSFILSTHNTIAGQISLALDNPGYNTTYTQGSLSFEHALLDAWLGLKENRFHSLVVGAADEVCTPLYNIGKKLGDSSIDPAGGGSFFVLGATELPESVRLMGVQAISFSKDILRSIQEFLKTSGVSTEQISMVIHSCGGNALREEISSLIPSAEMLFLPDLVGYYLTNSAFGLHFGMDAIQQGGNKGFVLVINQIWPENLGLMLLGPIKTDA